MRLSNHTARALRRDMRRSDGSLSFWKVVVTILVIIGIAACSQTETVRETDMDGVCVYRTVDRLFGVTVNVVENTSVYCGDEEP